MEQLFHKKFLAALIQIPFFFLENNFNIDEAKTLFSDKKLDLIPVLNKNHTVLDIITPLDIGDHIERKKEKNKHSCCNYGRRKRN